ncbi:MAG: WD40 repeat domain-containing protein [Bacteroidota bacterium]
MHPEDGLAQAGRVQPRQRDAAYDECTKKLIYTLDKRIKIHTIKASPNGKYVALDCDQMLEICPWDKEKKTLSKNSMQYRTYSSSCISFSPDSRFLFFTKDRTSVVIIDIPGERKIELLECEELVGVISFNHSNRFVTMNLDRVDSIVNRGSIVNVDTAIRIWHLPLKRLESPGLVPFIVRKEWKLPIEFCANEIFTLIAQYAFELDLPFRWVWKKNKTERIFFPFSI